MRFRAIESSRGSHLLQWLTPENWPSTAQPLGPRQPKVRPSRKRLVLDRFYLSSKHLCIVGPRKVAEFGSCQVRRGRQAELKSTICFRSFPMAVCKITPTLVTVSPVTSAICR